MTLDRRRLLATASALIASLPLGAAQASVFDGSWQHQTFPRRTPNAYSQSAGQVEVASDSGVSLLLRALPEEQWTARQASWTWEVSASVPPTDLAQRGGDDRNIALYFVFLDLPDAERLRGGSARQVLTNRASRSLVYVWGGNGNRGQLVSSPWLRGQGRLVLLRPAGTGRFSETVDLARDHARAFGSPPGALFGLGISADSDDTASTIRARLSALTLA